MMLPVVQALYDDLMLVAIKHRVCEWLHRTEHLLPCGFSWSFVAAIDLTMAAIGAIATLQRPVNDWPIALVAMAIAFSPWLVFFVFGIAEHEGPALWLAWTLGTAILLFATSTPITGDFAPLLLSLTVGVVSAITSVRGGVLAAISSWAMLVCAAAMHRIVTPQLYLTFVGIGLLVGYLVRIQQQLLIKQRQAQAQLAAHSAADERRRIAREVHDVIAHSLSITLLHLTGARHALEHDRDDEDAVQALQRAELLGRQAMDDIGRTVGLLDAERTGGGPEPGITDIPGLAEDFIRAGLKVTVAVDGQLGDASPAVGLALYRIAQESLSNTAKDAPATPVTMTLAVSPSAAAITVINEVDRQDACLDFTPGNGLRGMRQRAELLGGTIDVGPFPGGWLVHATIPASAGAGGSPTLIAAS